MRWPRGWKRCSPRRKCATRWSRPAWRWWKKAAVRSNAPWRWWRRTCRRHPEVAAGKRALLLRLLDRRPIFLRQLRVGVRRQQAVHVGDVVHVQRAGGLLEQQPVLQEVVLGQRVLALRVEQLLLVDQHVDDRTRADLEADLRGVVRTLRRDQRQAARLDLADARDQGLVGVAGVAHQRALLLLQLVARDVALRDRLAHARLRGAAGEDRHVQREAERRAAAFAARGRGEGKRGVAAGKAAFAPGGALAVAA